MMDFASGSLALIERRYGDDRNYHEQFNQGETVSLPASAGICAICVHDT
jgi:hypothetical protein